MVDLNRTTENQPSSRPIRRSVHTVEKSEQCHGEGLCEEEEEHAKEKMADGFLGKTHPTHNTLYALEAQGTPQTGTLQEEH